MSTNGKPFVYLFKSPYGFYVFDVNKNSVLKISEPAYDLLNEEINNKSKDNDKERENNDEAKNIIQSLKNRGFLSSKRVKEIVHPDDALLEEKLQSKMQKITLQITQNCNLRCRYCAYSGSYIQRRHTNKRMSSENAKKAIDFFIEHSRDSSILSVGFYGGEPLLDFELIKECIQYMKKKSLGKKTKFSITTNGTVMNDEMIDFLKDNEVNLSISLDGPEAVHNRNRRFSENGKGSYQKVIENVQYISSQYPEYMDKVSISAVIDPQNSLRETSDFFKNDASVKDVHMMPSSLNTNYAKEQPFESEDFLVTNKYETFKSFLVSLNQLDLKYVSPIALQNFSNIKMFAEKLKPTNCLPDVAHPGGPCVPGELRAFIDCDGNILPCERVSEKSEVMRIGHIDSGFDYKKTRDLLNIGKLTAEKCKNCRAFKHCTLCAAAADNITELSPVLKSSNCNRVRSSLEESLKDYVILKELGVHF